jgi:UDP-N-acetylmuramoyl-tripeptide--D-alanyl-D-alanine ligase
VIWALLVVTIAGVVCSDVRWLRVAQREHYLPGSVSVFWRRWWFGGVANTTLYLSPLVCVLLALVSPWFLVLVPLPAIAGPVGLSLRGRTSKLVWTKRLKTLAAATGMFQLCLLLVLSAVDVVLAALVLTVTSAFGVEVGMRATLPLQRREADRFANKARARLSSIRPRVVAITGSYGKTGTKNYAAHLIAGTKHVLATPKSFNNKGGLCRAINEHLAPGVEVFIAEMGTYGPGEINELCQLVPPDIAVITAIGPVHLERFGSEDAIVKAKSEIFTKASTCIVNIDEPRLEALVPALRQANKRVVTVGSSSKAADVRVEIDEHLRVFRGGQLVADVAAPDAPATNVACAIAVALEVGVSWDALTPRLSSLPVVEHRQSTTVAETGFTVIDDTFNANPASMRRGLDLLEKAAPNGRRVIATPGMVELGSRQHEENRLFTNEASGRITDLVVIGRTNRAALLEGVTGADVNTVVVDTLPQAVEWMRHHVGKGDAVFYANDLPDHYA